MDTKKREESGMIRILVVGGRGFIGHHIVDRAVQLGWDVTSLNFSPNQSDVQATNAVRYLTADIASKITLEKALEHADFEYVVNCGGYIDHSSFFKDGRKIIDTHFIGVLNLVESLNRNVLKSFVNIGSSDEYGSCSAPQSELCRESPISPYSLAKVAASHFLQMLFRTESFPATTLRLFLTYGPGQDRNRFLPQIISGCLNNSTFATSEGEQLRDFCFISDTVDAIFSVFECSKAHGEIINIASGNPVSIRQVINNVKSQIGAGNPMFGEVAYRKGENMALYANIDKAEKILGWKPKVTLDMGLSQTIKWYRDN